MDVHKLLGMELDLVLDSLRPTGANIDIQYTLPLRNPIDRHTARVVRVNTVNETILLTVAYETSRKGGADAWHT